MTIRNTLWTNHAVILVVCGVALVLCCVSCGPSPQDFAEATVIAAQPGATATAAAPGHQATATAVAVESEIKTATEDDWVAFWENALWWGAICICTLIVVGTVVAGKFVHRVSAAAEKAAEKRMELAASVIRVDKNTQTWPILVDWKEGWIINLETGERVPIRTISLPNPQQLAISHRVREANVYARAATDIGKSAKDARAADMFPGVAASIPLLSKREEGEQ